MPLNAVGWSSEEDEKLVELVQPHSFLYNVFDPSRKNILARETTWQEIAEQLSKPVEECKKRWRGLRDGYTRIKRLGTMHKTKVVIYEKLQFLDGTSLDGTEETIRLEEENTEEQPVMDESIGTEQQVITDNQEYYEITLVDGPQAPLKPYIKILPKKETSEEPPKKICRKNAGRKKAIPVPKNIPPIKILPKPIVMNGPKIVHYVEDPKVPEQRSQTIDKLIEKILKENTNEIDVFFRSMAASVKKLQPNLIPKVKMEVCNVIAKYEMQNFDKNLNF
ncbi:transcription factor Adf-1-like [Trichoplusia ni]|uniref:Transcription factor Adf-1-like n=1 Tax=Trichoplusia ni TaxID=7111 RepID=A0A7E5VGI3_TRINI|nr:transcription factor Adf-1-like [Trichoplusia ni]